MLWYSECPKQPFCPPKIKQCLGRSLAMLVAVAYIGHNKAIRACKADKVMVLPLFEPLIHLENI